MPPRRNCVLKTKKRVVTFDGGGKPHQDEFDLENLTVFKVSNPSTGPPLLSTEEAAEYLHCSKSLLNKFRVRGGGPDFVRVGDDLIRYERDALDAYVASRTRRSTAQQVA
jgi:excisionase family DNA binding protein